MIKKITFLLLSSFLILTGCDKSDNTEELVIASQKGDCMGVAPMKCYLIKREGQTNWEYFYDEINGFDFEPGYEYNIKVKKEARENPAADQSAFKYTMVKQISKIQKVSESQP